MSRQGSIPGRPSIPDPTEDQIRTHACELIELVRNQSGLSYNLAQDTIHSVLKITLIQLLSSVKILCKSVQLFRRSLHLYIETDTHTVPY